MQKEELAARHHLTIVKAEALHFAEALQEVTGAWILCKNNSRCEAVCPISVQV